MQPKKYQRYNSEIYLEDKIFYKVKTIKITASSDVWMMTKSVLSVTAIVGYNCCHTPRHRIKKTLIVSFGCSNPCGFHIFSKPGVAAGGVSQASRCVSIDTHFRLAIDRDNK